MTHSNESINRVAGMYSARQKKATSNQSQINKTASTVSSRTAQMLVDYQLGNLKKYNYENLINSLCDDLGACAGLDLTNDAVLRGLAWPKKP